MIITKKIFNISVFDKYHKDHNIILEEFKEQISNNWKNIFKVDFDVESYVELNTLCKNMLAEYYHLFYGDELIGYFGIVKDHITLSIVEFYLRDKYCTSKYFKEIISFIKEKAKTNNNKTVVIEVFNNQSIINKLKLLKLKSATSLMYMEVE